jgi:hypothetical protein
VISTFHELCGPREILLLPFQRLFAWKSETLRVYTFT